MELNLDTVKKIKITFWFC